MEENWQERVSHEIDTRTQSYTEQELKNYSVPTLRNLIAKLPTQEASAQQREVLQGNIEAIVMLLPMIPNTKDEAFGLLQKRINALKKLVREQYKLVSKGYYSAIWLPLGIGIGLPWGAMFKNIALGIPIGVGIGLGIGGYLDRKAEKEGRVI
ncbi:hypothetical protein [Rufibacter immobilis]|uniref:hypothetical protein n=1 Tax=Rufibacter immobilis TaxID=1348778 RepID=UPI0035EB9A20